MGRSRIEARGLGFPALIGRKPRETSDQTWIKPGPRRDSSGYSQRNKLISPYAVKAWLVLSLHVTPPAQHRQSGRIVRLCVGLEWVDRRLRAGSTAGPHAEPCRDQHGPRQLFAEPDHHSRYFASLAGA